MNNCVVNLSSWKKYSLVILSCLIVSLVLHDMNHADEPDIETAIPKPGNVGDTPDGYRNHDEYDAQRVQSKVIETENLWIMSTDIMQPPLGWDFKMFPNPDLYNGVRSHVDMSRPAFNHFLPERLADSAGEIQIEFYRDRPDQSPNNNADEFELWMEGNMRRIRVADGNGGGGGDNDTEPETPEYHWGTSVDAGFIRFTRREVDDDDTNNEEFNETNILMVSNFVSDDGFQPNDEAPEDEDNFFVEYVDAGNQFQGRNQIEATLEARTPGDREFPAALNRTATIILYRVQNPNPNQNIFRSIELRLVVDDVDRVAANGTLNNNEQRALIVDTDIDAQGTDHIAQEDVEILGQRVKATVRVGDDDVETVVRVADHDGRQSETQEDNISRLRMAVFVYDEDGQFTQAEQAAQAPRRLALIRWLRRNFAQAGITSPTEQNLTIRPFGPVNNLLSINDVGHANATGVPLERSVPTARVIRITIELADETEIDFTVNVAINQTPLQIANAIATQYNASIPVANVNTRAMVFTNSMKIKNNARQPVNVPSADVLFPDAVAIETRQAGRNSHRTLQLNQGEFTGSLDNIVLRNAFAANRDARTVLRNYRRTSQGPDQGRIPDNTTAFFMVNEIDEVAGFATPAGQYMFQGGGRTWRSMPGIRNSVFVEIDKISTLENSILRPFRNRRIVLPFLASHEISHLLLDYNHTNIRTELMVGGETDGTIKNRNTVNAAKRITDGNVSFGIDGLQQYNSNPRTTLVVGIQNVGNHQIDQVTTMRASNLLE